MKIFYIFVNEKKEFYCYVLTVKKQKVAQRILGFKFKEPLTEDEINMLEWACKNYKRY